MDGDTRGQETANDGNNNMDTLRMTGGRGNRKNKQQKEQTNSGNECNGEELAHHTKWAQTMLDIIWALGKFCYVHFLSFLSSN